MIVLGRPDVVGGGGGTSLSTAKLIKTGQTVSYRTGDDGDLQAGRDIDFFTLAENNPFGNANRFTDELGGQTYTDDIVIDWSTYDGEEVLGYYRNTSTGTWNTAIDNSLALSVGIFTSGWRLPNRTEVNNIVGVEGLTSNYTFNYSPFNIGTPTYFWCSTTSPANSASAWTFVNNAAGTIAVQSKTINYGYFSCRTFTVTGATLT